jgi:phosphoribosylformimino-5-aminoimidazole carboxamide ribotide isomerase
MNGQVVRAVAGRRAEYKPIVSDLVQSTEPLTVGRALLQASRAKELYVADLTAIQSELPSGLDVADFVRLIDCTVWFDGGFGPHTSRPASFPRSSPVIGFETCQNINFLNQCLSSQTSNVLGFSVDLRNGELVGDWQAWGLESSRDAMGLARKVIDAGVRHLFVLDLARVGTGTGCGTDVLLKELGAEFPEVEVIAGGGITDMADVEKLGEIGVEGVLVASALHIGSIKVGY